MIFATALGYFAPRLTSRSGGLIFSGLRRTRDARTCPTLRMDARHRRADRRGPGRQLGGDRLRRRRLRIDYTLARFKGVGLLRKATKSIAGERTLTLPALPCRCSGDANSPRARRGPVFPDAIGGWRDPSNTSRDLRNARGSAEFGLGDQPRFRKPRPRRWTGLGYRHGRSPTSSSTRRSPLLGRRRDRHRRDPAAVSESELLRRTIRADCQNRTHRSHPELRRAAPADRTCCLRRPLQPSAPTSCATTSAATP